MKHELRGIELVRTVNSKLVSVVAFFKEIFWNSEFDKNYMTSNMFCFTIMSLVISRPSCFRLAEIWRKGSSMKVLFYLVSSWLSPNRTSVFSFWIQNFSLSLTFLAVLLWSHVCQWWRIWHVCWNYVLSPENVFRLEWN